MWSDKTTAVYLNLTFTDARWPHCASFLGAVNESLSIVPCDLELQASYLCEIVKLKTGTSAGIIFPTPSDWTTESMAKCPLGHVTHNFLACDVKSNCFEGTNHRSVGCLKGLVRSGPYFTCRNQVERVPFSLVCDYKADCCDESDEDFCQFPACEGRKLYMCANTQVNLLCTPVSPHPVFLCKVF